LFFLSNNTKHTNDSLNYGPLLFVMKTDSICLVYCCASFSTKFCYIWTWRYCRPDSAVAELAGELFYLLQYVMFCHIFLVFYVLHFW